MTVIKKSGKKEEFSADKLFHSIKAANAQTNETINISAILGEFQQIVSGKQLVTTGQIDIIVYGLFYAKGHLQTLMTYVSYDKK